MRDSRFLILEGFMVVFSVLAALAVDEWREDVQTRERVALATDRLDVALAISERIMEQQLVWVEELIPLYDAFLARWRPA